MTDDRPRACTAPPWQYILDRRDRERERVRNEIHQRFFAVNACKECQRMYRGYRPDGICGICRADEMYREDKPDGP